MLETATSPDGALVSWLREVVEFTGNYQGVVDVMMAAKEDPESALYLHVSRCARQARRLLIRAQAEGLARTDMDGDDLFSLAAALAWLSNQPSSAPRADHLFSIIASAILTNRASTDFKARGQ